MESASTNKYKKNIDTEREYWMKTVLDKWIKYNTKCPSYNKNSLKLKKIKSVANPLKLQWNYYKCRKIINLRDNTIFAFYSKTPISILITILEEFILEEKNATKIIEKLNYNYSLSEIGKINIYKYLNIFRKCCAQYYDDVYKTEKLVYDNEYKNVAVDESLFIHELWKKRMVNWVNRYSN